MSASSLPTIVLSAPLPADLRERLQAGCRILEVPAGQSPAQALDAAQRESVQGVLCTMKTRIGPEELAALPRLRVVSNFAVGFDNIDIPAATQAGVLVCNTPGVLDKAVADLTLGLLICLARNLVQGDAFVRSGQWSKGAAPLTRDIRGKTLGLLGMGRIGREVAGMARALGMQVLYHNRRRDEAAEGQGLAQYRERDALFAESDFLSIHIPLSAETRHSIGAREIGLMKPSAYLINTARGAVINEAELIAALRAGAIAGAGLDVMENEPIDAGHPLCSLPNVILQAHVGSATTETRRAMIDLAAQNLLDALQDRRPAAMVNPSVWQAGATLA
ncbi:2-hydroxyacid dehydrogenase [Bordetella hinzii]|uniref:4-phosphoerythronate dehydrogenase n=1 Tax=Bordetella hinzii OH87 BAL007II TaxID=1331262 RepID=A0ABR4R8S4_9BORD|nr:D-glycerate dehydrogenase [Bordetella hinzii]KCB26165.1 4-phosphoerythronate dehydrogenase [Bordetella hinzii OH87 BAL007II]KCB32499.1 4-phosphoerythronate dehydrogenase [Bordetella hinzii CA90 BAL1384]KCB39685.1 4-phosphoerythronate dehydrogenase [Bordetella hinzii 5132]KCB52678.1 4-phosphoerythronate dehydrogenase [Bordetella hinzii 1277]QDJ40378.1 D-glycerate dehydrogenase [Bordetella hinzii]